MRAAVFKGAGTPLVVEDVPEPTPGPSDLVIEVKACGVPVIFYGGPTAGLLPVLPETGADVVLEPATDADMRGANAKPKASLEVIYDDA